MTRRFGAARRLLMVASVLVALALSLAACSSATSSSAPAVVDSGPNTGGLRGDVLHPAVTLDAAARGDVFRTSAGSSTTLGRLQGNHLMLLYFGYTHCPDVCPTTMADLGTALRALPAQDQAHIQVVFVTSDPARDSPPVMKAWLSNFDQGLPLPFVGLTASISRIDSVAKSVGVPLAPPVKQHNGTITVQHGAQTLAFVGGQAHVVWLAGTSPADYEHDLSRLVTSVRTTSMPSTATAGGTAHAHVGDLSITGGYVPQPASPSVAAAYFTVTNSGSRPDVLTKVTTDVTSSVRPMSESDTGSTGTMTQLPSVVVPAHGSFRFTQGHDHLMLEHPDQKLMQGDTVRMTITFEHAGTVSLNLPVVGFTGPSSSPMTSMSPSPMDGSGSGTTHS